MAKADNNGPLMDKKLIEKIIRAIPSEKIKEITKKINLMKTEILKSK